MTSSGEIYIKENVARGVEFLDIYDPGWWWENTDNAINLRTLNLGLGDRCILGQRCPLETLRARGYDREYGYDAQRDALMTKAYGDAPEFGDDDWAQGHGFITFRYHEYLALTSEWKRVITERREQAR